MARKKKTMDGNQAAAHVSYAYSDVAAIYPITPSSTMAEVTDEWATEGRKNIFGQTVKVTEMQSEAGAAGAVHGSLAAGALTTTFTASQGLLLMIPNLYKIAGELLPGVFNVAARTIATHALSIFGDHSDIYSCRQTGVAMLASGSVQEVMDLTPIAHLTAIKGKVPFINFFDGFRTSHEMQKIDVWDYEELKSLLDMDAVMEFRKNALNPNHARMMGSAQNPDIYFQAREASNSYYITLPELVESYMKKVNDKIGTNYGLFNYYGAQDATHIIVAMGSVCETIKETIDYLNKSGQKTGLVEVHLYRPFSAKHLLSVIPDSVGQITVLDRTKEPGAIGEPLYLDVIAALRDTKFHNVPVLSGRYGLGSKNTTPDQINAVFKNNPENGKKVFTIGIVDDLTHLSLNIDEKLHTAPEGTIGCKFWGLGGDGTVSANKSSIKIIGNHTNKYVQAYFDYDSKKSRGITVSHLRFGDAPIRSTYLINRADFVACHNPTYLHKYNMVQDVKDGGTFLLNCYWKEKDLEENIPGQVKRYIAEHNINFYIIDAIEIGKEIGLNDKISTILQAAFFRLANIMPIEEVSQLMKDAADVSYRKKGDKIVQMNFDAIDRGIEGLVKVNVPKEWLDAEYEPLDAKLLPDREEVIDFVEHVQKIVNAQEGNTLPVSTFAKYVDGSTPSGSAAHERRYVTTEVPEWIPENCIQCNRCAFVCPHAVIRPAAMTEEEIANAPEGMMSIPMLGMPGYVFSINVSEVDCTGCGSCAAVCPGKQGQKALAMCPINEHEQRQQYFDYAKSLPVKTEAVEKFKETTVKGSQFKRPLLEFSGACAGCGETPYARLVTQLFGDRMYIANATGCSSIWGNSSPSTPYTVNELGQGPAWSNSLFEDAAEFGYGMTLAQKAIRGRLKEEIETLADSAAGDLKDAAAGWLDTFADGALNGAATDKLISALEDSTSPEAKELLEEKDFFSKKSQWIFGGDGWAYDIGFGGLDHVIASGQDINIMVFDTEVYSNTGGQSSKATPTGSTAKFASGGKIMKKKDLASIAMSYGYVYVAQIAMGADYSQTVKVIAEAEKYDGPSLIIAYAPCISHGIRSGMGSSQHEEAKAVESGYWHLFRYNPALKDEGKNPFILDSKEPTLAYEEFLAGENRYDVLRRSNPEKAAELFSAAAENAKERFEYLSRLVKLHSSEE
ncbi:pyruvate-ferredoxin/flavodoxin oxidoreductase [Kineothrix alysoides]|uniref:Pyruvate:ferredoxin oxidoreductase n=1 Tax=Kineothrix alysoides TaxID=1469948 RepID=A0A4R1QTE5_9FIRM|nr:pyruvate:ferredoxin (flavodoxin) oxidoreductase [Kineothrix alysoides]TCL54134.1 pyruvate-ferredoxin/flavodoxin oxidoreductase [Kineothrix alysoides]